MCIHLAIYKKSLYKVDPGMSLTGNYLKKVNQKSGRILCPMILTSTFCIIMKMELTSMTYKSEVVE